MINDIITDPLHWRWFDFVHRRPGRALRLFCFPYAGGSATIYRQWHTQLNPAIEVWPFQLPGRAQRIGEPPIRNLQLLSESIIEALLPALDIPFIFFGHSMGAIVAWHVSKILEKSYKLSPRALMVSGACPPHIKKEIQQIHLLGDRELVTKLRELGGTPEEILANPDALGTYLPFIRADFQAIEEYTTEDFYKLKCPIIGFAGDCDPVAPAGEMNAWQDLTISPFSCSIIKGNHFFITSDECRFMPLLSHALEGIVFHRLPLGAVSDSVFGAAVQSPD